MKTKNLYGLKPGDRLDCIQTKNPDISEPATVSSANPKTVTLDFRHGRVDLTILSDVYLKRRPKATRPGRLVFY